MNGPTDRPTVPDEALDIEAAERAEAHRLWARVWAMMTAAAVAVAVAAVVIAVRGGTGEISALQAVQAALICLGIGFVATCRWIQEARPGSPPADRATTLLPLGAVPCLLAVFLPTIL